MHSQLNIDRYDSFLKHLSARYVPDTGQSIRERHWGAETDLGLDSMGFMWLWVRQTVRVKF